jgi:hypothetical protein
MERGRRRLRQAKMAKPRDAILSIAQKKLSLGNSSHGTSGRQKKRQPLPAGAETLGRKKKIMNFNDVSTPDKTIASGSDLWPRSAAAL